MVDPVTPNKAFAIPTRGSDVGVWDLPINGDFTAIDNILGSGQTISLSASAVTLTQTQANNLYFNLTGTLLANVVVSFPAIGGLFIIKNSTSGAFTVTINTVASGSTGIIVAQGDTQLVYLDGTNAYQAAPSVDYFPSGTSMLFAQASAPPGWTQVTANNDMALRIVSGTGGATHGTVGLSTFISNGALGHTLVLSEIPSHNHGVNDPGHTHLTNAGPSNVGIQNNNIEFCPQASNNTTQVSGNVTGISIQLNGGDGSHVHALSDLTYLDLVNATRN